MDERDYGSGFFDGFEPSNSEIESYRGPQCLVVYNATKGDPQTYYIDEHFSEATQYGKMMNSKASGFIKDSGSLVVMLQTVSEENNEVGNDSLSTHYYYYHPNTGNFQFLQFIQHDASIRYFDSSPYSLSHQENYLVLSQELLTTEDDISFQLMVCPTEGSSLNPTIILPRFYDEATNNYNDFLCWID